MNKYYIIALVLFITSMVSFYALVRRNKEASFDDVKTHEDCAEKALGLGMDGNVNNGDTCASWVAPDCVKGSVITSGDGKKFCYKSRDFLGIIYMILARGGFVGSIICFVVGVMKKNDREAASTKGSDIVKKNG